MKTPERLRSTWLEIDVLLHLACGPVYYWGSSDAVHNIYCKSFVESLLHFSIEEPAELNGFFGPSHASTFSESFDPPTQEDPVQYHTMCSRTLVSSLYCGSCKACPHPLTSLVYSPTYTWPDLSCLINCKASLRHWCQANGCGGARVDSMCNTQCHAGVTHTHTHLHSHSVWPGQHSGFFFT